MKYREPGILDTSEHYFLRPSAFALKHLYCALSMGRFQVDSSYLVSRLNYSKFLLIFVQEGRVSCQNDGYIGTAAANQLLLLDCAKPHVYFALTDSSFFFVHFDGGEASALCRLITEQAGVVISAAKPQEYLHSFQRLLSLAHTDHVSDEARASAEIYHLLMLLVTDTSTRGAAASKRGVVDQAVAYINNHLTDELSLTQLAGQFGYSAGYFTKLFRQHTGLSPHQFILHSRLEYARHLIATTRLSVQEVAARAGFHDASSFCSAFRRDNGMTPMEYRKRPL